MTSVTQQYRQSHYKWNETKDKLFKNSILSYVGLGAINDKGDLLAKSQSTYDVTFGKNTIEGVPT